MVLVYAESETHAEPLAILPDEETYEACSEALVALAEKYRMKVTESCDPTLSECKDFYNRMTLSSI